MIEKETQEFELDFDSLRTVDFYPYEEVEKIMEALEAAEKKSDLAALKWCARKILWFFEMADTSTGSISPEMARRLFKSAYTAGADKPPASITGFLAGGFYGA